MCLEGGPPRPSPFALRRYSPPFLRLSIIPSIDSFLDRAFTLRRTRTHPRDTLRGLLHLGDQYCPPGLYILNHIVYLVYIYRPYGGPVQDDRPVNGNTLDLDQAQFRQPLGGS
eukprot:6776878-Pyramimonas_sp.AAC.2